MQLEQEEYMNIERRETIQAEARKLRKQFLRYKEAEIVYSISHETGLSQEYFAELLGVCRSSVTLYESDKRQPDYELLKSIAKVLSTTTTYLLEGEDLTLDDDSMEMLHLYKKLKSTELKSVAKAQLMALINLVD